MMYMVKQYWIGVFLVITSIVISSCGPKPVININYQPPGTSTVLSGKSMSVVIEDQRTDASILDTMARHELRNFTGQFSYNLSMEEKIQKIGVYDLSNVFQKTLKERLTRMGANVLDGPIESEPELVILLKEFRLTFDDRIWSVAINYKVQLKVDGKVLAKEDINGSGTRVKIVGTGDADKLLSSVYSDVVNQLNIEQLFVRAEALK